MIYRNGWFGVEISSSVLYGNIHRKKIVKSVARRSGKVCLGGMVEMQVLYGVITLDLDALLCLELGAAPLVDHR